MTKLLYTGYIRESEVSRRLLKGDRGLPREGSVAQRRAFALSGEDRNLCFYLKIIFLSCYIRQQWGFVFTIFSLNRRCPWSSSAAGMPPGGAPSRATTAPCCPRTRTYPSACSVAFCSFLSVRTGLHSLLCVHKKYQLLNTSSFSLHRCPSYRCFKASRGPSTSLRARCPTSPNHSGRQHGLGGLSRRWPTASQDFFSIFDTRKF